MIISYWSPLNPSIHKYNSAHDSWLTSGLMSNATENRLPAAGRTTLFYMAPPLLHSSIFLNLTHPLGRIYLS